MSGDESSGESTKLGIDDDRLYPIVQGLDCLKTKHASRLKEVRAFR
jgi:hypothetical protein